MAVDKAYLVTIASEFSSVSEERVTELVAIAAMFVNPSRFGAKTDYATALFVAHMLKLDQLQGSGGLTQEKVGDVSRSYASTGSKSNDNGLRLTSYGSQFIMVRGSCTLARGPLIT